MATNKSSLKQGIAKKSERRVVCHFCARTSVRIPILSYSESISPSSSFDWGRTDSFGEEEFLLDERVFRQGSLYDSTKRPPKKIGDDRDTLAGIVKGTTIWVCSDCQAILNESRFELSRSRCW